MQYFPPILNTDEILLSYIGIFLSTSIIYCVAQLVVYVLLNRLPFTNVGFLFIVQKEYDLEMHIYWHKKGKWSVFVLLIFENHSIICDEFLSWIDMPFSILHIFYWIYTSSAPLTIFNMKLAVSPKFPTSCFFRLDQWLWFYITGIRRNLRNSCFIFI